MSQRWNCYVILGPQSRILSFKAKTFVTGGHKWLIYPEAALCVKVLADDVLHIRET